MTYTFDAADGETRASLAERVTFNSFSSARYGEYVKRALNDAVTAICRRPGFGEGYEVQPYDVTGLVVPPSRSWIRVDEAWTTNATAAAVGDYAFIAAASTPLRPLTDHDLGSLGVGGGPIGYNVRRAAAPLGFSPALDVHVLPAGTAGFVAIKGLQRPLVMDSDADGTGLGAEFDGAVVAYAKAACFDNEDDFDAAAQWRLRFDAELRQLSEGGINPDGPVTVDGMWES
jgi:hypothetical protein